MATRKGSAATSAPAAWAPPAGAQELELSEFYAFGQMGEVVLGRVQRVTERPDPQHADKIMRAMILSPAIAIAATGKGEAYKSLAVGLSAHLGLLIGDVKKEIGSCYAIQYQGTRPSEGKGKQPSKQFGVWKLSEEQFAAEVKKVAGKHAASLLDAAPAAPADDDDELPF